MQYKLFVFVSVAFVCCGATPNFDRVLARMKEKKAKKEKKEKKEKKRKKSSGSVSGENKNKTGVEQINRDDYYRKATEFREWLRKSKGVYFEDLTSEKAKDRFDSIPSLNQSKNMF